MDGQGTSSGRPPLSSGGEVASKNRYDPDGHEDDLLLFLFTKYVWYSNCALVLGFSEIKQNVMKSFAKTLVTH